MSSEPFVREAELAEAANFAAYVERKMLESRIELLTTRLREHGLVVPGDDPRLGVSEAEHLLRCRAVVTAAYDLLAAIETFEARLAELRRIVGPGMELVREGPSWRSKEAT